MTNATIPQAPNDCDKCPALVACRRCVVPGVGKSDARIMFVGPNPGPNEDYEGKPFVGKSGQLLALLCDAAGIQRSGVYRTNAVRCLSPGNRRPKREEIEACRDYLIDEIRAVNPAVIVTLGEVPLTSLIGMTGIDDYLFDLHEWEQANAEAMKVYEEALGIWQGMTTPQRRAAGLTRPLKPRSGLKPKPPKAETMAIRDVAGHSLIQQDTGIPLIPSYHPAFLMRGQWSMTEVVISHLEKARRIADGEQSVGHLGEYHVIQTLPALRALHDYLLSDGVDMIWFDTETTGINWQRDELLCISFATQPGEGYVVPLLYNTGDPDIGIDLWPAWDGNMREVNMLLREVFASDKDKGGQNVLFDMRILERSHTSTFIEAATAFGFEIGGRVKDTELIHHAIAESLPHNMTTNLALWTDMPYYEHEIKPFKRHMDKAPNDIIWPYSAADADGLPQMWEPMREIAEAEGVDWVLDNITAPMLRVCRALEDNGFPINEEYFGRLSKFYVQEIAAAEEELWQAVPSRPPGWKYNYAPTLREVLFKELNIPTSGRKTQSGRGCTDCDDGVCFEHDQTGKDALNDIIAMSTKPHPALAAIIKLKNLTKRYSVYLEGGRGGMRRYIRADKRIHPTMKISRAETGRLASELPNAQNIPNYVHIHPIGETCAEDGCKSFYANTFGINTSNAFHDLIEAPPGRGIMNADWSQLEVWVLAYRLWRDTGDRTLLDVLESGTDIHLFMARKMFPEVDPHLDDRMWKNTYPELRRRGKTMVFGVGYGLTEQGAALRLGCSEEEARDTIKRYKDVVPGLDVYFRQIRKQLYDHSYVENEFGRRRHIKHLAILKAMHETGELEAAIREGINFPIQSGGSDLHSVVSYRTFALDALRNRNCDIILSVHDSLSFEFDWPDNDVAVQTAWIIKNLWQDTAWELIKPNGDPLHWRVPVEIEWGQSWGTPEWKLDAKGTLQELKEA